MDSLTTQAVNRLAVGIASIVVNLGARHLPASLSPRLQAITSSKGMRIVVVFALFFLSTRDPMLSVALACVFFVLTSTILHEDSRYSWLPMIRSPVVPLPITREVYDTAVETVLRFRRQARTALANTAIISPAVRGPGHP